MAVAKKRTHPKSADHPLNAKEVKFCQYLMTTDGTIRANQTRAYYAAGFTAPNDSAAATYASRLVRKRNVLAYLRHLQKVAADAAKVTVEEIAAGIANIAKADRRKLFDKKGRILPPDQWPDDVADTIEGIESEEIFETVAEDENGKKTKRRKELKGYARKVKTASRMQAWAKLAEWMRMTGGDKSEPEKGKAEQLVVGGDADVNKV